MRVSTVFKYTAKFEYWTVIRNSDTTFSYVKDSDRTGLLVPSGSTIHLTSDKQMVIGSQVRSLFDRSGVEVTKVVETSYPLYVHSAEPQMDPFGSVIGWRHSLRREPPRDMEQFLRDMVEQVAGAQ